MNIVRAGTMKPNYRSWVIDNQVSKIGIGIERIDHLTSRTVKNYSIVGTWCKICAIFKSPVICHINTAITYRFGGSVSPENVVVYIQDSTRATHPDTSINIYIISNSQSSISNSQHCSTLYLNRTAACTVTTGCSDVGIITDIRY